MGLHKAITPFFFSALAFPLALVTNSCHEKRPLARMEENYALAQDAFVNAVRHFEKIPKLEMYYHNNGSYSVWIDPPSTDFEMLEFSDLTFEQLLKLKELKEIGVTKEYLAELDILLEETNCMRIRRYGRVSKESGIYQAIDFAYERTGSAGIQGMFSYTFYKTKVTEEQKEMIRNSENGYFLNDTVSVGYHR